nr:hypothetical protein [Tanacetum cinerariifolium]
MHRRNEGISSSSALLNGVTSTIPQCLSKEYKDHLRRSHEDFQPFPRIFTKTIFTHEEPGALYKCYQLKANQTPIRMDKSDAWISPKYALDNQPKTTTGQIKEKMFEFKTRKPEESSSNWKPWHRDWDATTFNFLEDDASNDDNKSRYNSKGFLEDDDARSDDSIFIMDPGWVDYCLQELKLNRHVPHFLEARRARM